MASFYTMYRRGPTGDYLVGVCTNTLCAVIGGDAIFDALKDHLGIVVDETSWTTGPSPGASTTTGGDEDLVDWPTGILRQPDHRPAWRTVDLPLSGCSRRPPCALLRAFRDCCDLVPGSPNLVRVKARALLCATSVVAKDTGMQAGRLEDESADHRGNRADPVHHGYRHDLSC